MSRRKRIPLEIQLAAALLAHRREDGSPVITFQEAKTLTPKQIRAKFDLDHYPCPVWAGGIDAPWNLVFRPKSEHRKKTAKVDIPAAAKSKRIRADEAAFRQRMLSPDVSAKADRPQNEKARALPGSKKSRYRKKLNGRVELRR